MRVINRTRFEVFSTERVPFTGLSVAAVLSSVVDGASFVDKALSDWSAPVSP